MLRRALSTRSLFTVAALLLAGGASAQTKLFTVDADFDTGTLNNTQHVPSNQIVLGRTPVSKTHLVWSTNYYPGFVVRIDTLTGKQTSRFDSALQFINGQPTGARPSQEVCDWANFGNCPGRVAVDTNGDVWIVNRAFGKQGTLSKFSGDLTHCIDRNNNGIIDTSSDKNNDGIIDMNPANGEYFGQNDECILTTIPVGPNNAYPRGVAVDKWGKIWVCTWQDGKLYRYNPNEPVALEMTVTLPGGTNPYSLASGGDYVFVSNSSGASYRVNILTGAYNSAPCPGDYGVVGDPSGNIAWLGSYFANTAGMYRANYTNNTCTLMGNGVGANTTAMTLDLTAGGPYVWSANYATTGGAATNTVSKYTTAGVLVGTYPAGGSYPHGLSVDFQNNLWVVTDSPPGMSKINPVNGQLLGTYSIGFLPAQASTFSAAPYLYSDFTGVQIDRQAPYTYVGSWDAVYDGGAAQIPWSKVSWNAEPQGGVPTYTSLKVAVKAADTLAQLGVAAYSVATSGATLSGIKGRFVQVRADLAGPGWQTPALSDLTVNGPCGTLGEGCCVKDADCVDANPCTTDVCPVPGGACVHNPTPGCCLTAADCNDSNACTQDSCPLAGGSCLHDPVPGCCNSNTDCSDNNLCTADICSGPGGTCTHPNINGCCNTDMDCTKGNKCSAAVCPTPGGFCVGGAIPGCCNGDADCADTDLCTLDVCDTSTSTCSNTKVMGCCNVDADCNDNDACTSDHCSGLGGSCIFSAIPSCCTPNDPKVGTPCDLPVSPHDQPPCKAGAFQCVNGALVCVGAVKPSIEICDGIDNDCDGVADSPPPCPIGELCITGVCVSPCQPGEFPCSPGLQCVNNYCLPTTCEKVVCPEGQVCVGGLCAAGDGGVIGDGGTSSSSSGGTGGQGTGGQGTGASTPDGGNTSSSSSGGGGTTSSSSGGEPSQKSSCGCETVGKGGDRTQAGIILAAAAMALSRLGRRSRKARKEGAQ